jgi:hypothetical protein
VKENKSGTHHRDGHNGEGPHAAGPATVGTGQTKSLVSCKMKSSAKLSLNLNCKIEFKILHSQENSEIVSQV